MKLINKPPIKSPHKYKEAVPGFPETALNLEPLIGFEPTTLSLRSFGSNICSTTQHRKYLEIKKML